MIELKPYTTVSSAIAFESKFMRLMRDEILGGNREKGEYFYETSRDVVHALGIDKAGNFVMVEEYRYPIKKIIIQPTGGKSEESESMADAARRELFEESGYQGGEIIPLGKTIVNPARADYWLHEFLIFDCEKVTTPHGGENVEETRPVLLPVNEVWEYIRQDKIESAHSLSTILKALIYLDKINFKP